jgi:predicted ATPase
MRATIEWSAGLLNAQQRRDLCRLSVFAGGATLAAAEAVCGVTLERLSVLVDHNLIHRSATTAGSRYLMLETIREYAAEQLRTRGEAEQIARCISLDEAVADALEADLP